MNDFARRKCRAQLKLLGDLVEFVNCAAVRCRQLHRMLHDGGQDVLEIQRRIDRLANFAQRTQLTKRLRQVVVTAGALGRVENTYLVRIVDGRETARALVSSVELAAPVTEVRRWSELMSIALRTNVAPFSVVEPLRHELRGAFND